MYTLLETYLVEVHTVKLGGIVLSMLSTYSAMGLEAEASVKRLTHSRKWFWKIRYILASFSPYTSACVVRPTTRLADYEEPSESFICPRDAQEIYWV